MAMRAGKQAGNFKARTGTGAFSNNAPTNEEYARVPSTSRDQEGGGTPLVGGASGQLTNEIAHTKFDRAELFMTSLSKEDLKPGAAMKAIALCLRYGVRPVLWLTSMYIKAAQFLYGIYKKLPMNYVQMIFGVGLCFAGGTFFATLAALEAAKQFGGQALLDELAEVYAQAQVAGEASLKDDEVDDDGDGVADVQQIGQGELINRKARVCMASVEDPERLMNAIQFLMSAWMSIIATLKFQFAQYVAIALGLADMISLPITRVFGKYIAMCMGNDLKHWVPTMIAVTVKIIAVSLVTFLVSVREGFYSALKGGSMFAEGFINELGKRGIMDKIPTWVPEALVSRPYDANQSYIDECIGWPLAAGGFVYQFMNGFMLEFPFSIILFPLTAFEWILRWSVFT